MADFYEIARKNKPLAAFYYQKAALGSDKTIVVLAETFKEKPGLEFNYIPDKNLAVFYEDLYQTMTYSCQILLKSAPRLWCKSAPPKNDV